MNKPVGAHVFVFFFNQRIDHSLKEPPLKSPITGLDSVVNLKKIKKNSRIFNSNYMSPQI